MAKQKTAFVCNDCGSDYAKWQGQCSDCGAWNTLAEIRLGPGAGKGAGRAGGGAGANRAGFAGALAGARILQDIDLADLPRFSSGTGEFDRVLGGGLVPGSAILVGGNPGAGKSTLLLQTMCHLAAHMDALYITGEESLQQVAMRANRLGLPTDRLRMMSETNVETIIAALEEFRPRVVVVDSIQVVHTAELASAPGSVSQVRECAAWLTRFAKQTGTVLVLVGHVTKDGSLAGPKVLEHMI
ncbi:MAG: AAA family ATPase, partial [Halioglobus sp.]